MSRLTNLDARRRLAILAVLCLAASACTSPVRAVRVDRTEAREDLTRSAVTTGQPSWTSENVLLERGLSRLYERDPDLALTELHESMVASGGDPDLLFALSELSFLYGQAKSRRSHQLAAAVYAYAFLFPEDAGVRPGELDPRLRLAADLYNWSLTAAFASPDGSEVELKEGTYDLPFGPIYVAFDPQELRAGIHELHHFVPVSELEVDGLAMRYRWPGIGAPLAASIVADEENARADLMAPRVQVPVTALLRVETARRNLIEQRPLASTLELHLAWDADEVEIGEEQVPLESDPTAALALTFTDVPILQLEIFGFLGRLSPDYAKRKPLASTTPYRKGLIPVVFVHGTASSPVRWAEMYNRLQSDRFIRDHYQFWFFQYESDNPIALSSLRLRESLADAIELLDPDGDDPALRDMVLIGHSQGGLLSKMQTIDSGDALWDQVSDKPLSEFRLTDEHRELLSRAMFPTPLPEVSRVIFISTPHRGSYLAAGTFVTNTIRRLTHLPTQLNSLWLDVARNLDASKAGFMPTAVDNMSPHSPFIQALQTIPVDPSIKAHSIISVKGDGPYEEGNDGVVKYTSAHIDGVESELVVRSPHSCQSHPDTMEEVRRILYLHVDDAEQTLTIDELETSTD